MLTCPVSGWVAWRDRCAEWRVRKERHARNLCTVDESLAFEDERVHAYDTRVSYKQNFKEVSATQWVVAFVCA